MNTPTDTQTTDDPSSPHEGGQEQQIVRLSANDERVYDQCVEIIKQDSRASSSLFQRRLGLGYSQAARLCEALEERGVIGPARGSRPRDIYIEPNG